MKPPVPSPRFSTFEFKQHVLTRLQQLAAQQEAQAYAPLLLALRKNAAELPCANRP
ncbi:hypothetical protein HER32_04500 [Hymenobacter sp. BT18]|uniref:hypothetical protein n=1 Tax=Hymenobacter TaxID=89966 RepID=UPI00143E3E03|nr:MULTISPECIES: hypothetical protein [Hymenobacter]QIX60486.1 hypothetical protein HER32_04500 [Hymenobacter sp. BT18]